MEFVTLVLSSILFILPAYIANMAPIFVHRFFGKYTYPIDFNKSFFDGKRIFGDGKTWAGLIAGTLVGGLVGASYSLNTMLGFKYGLALGFGALFGDLVKSFFKRRLGFERGKMWFPFDQIDFVLGAFLFYYLFFHDFDFKQLIILLLLTPALHLLTNFMGFKLKLKKEKW